MQNATREDRGLSSAQQALLCEIAQRAGAVAMTVYTALHHGVDGADWVQDKQDGSPVTEADLRAHRVIAAGLADLTPHIPVVSEEDAHSLQYRQPRGHFWLIDPLDGTKEFISGSDEFTVNIALVEDGRPVFGVVYAPALEQCYWGGATYGAFVRDGAGAAPQPLRISPRAASDPYRVIASKSHMSAETEAYIATLGVCELVQAGSSLKFCRVAEGKADVYPRLGPTCEWDTAAAHAVVEGAGGTVCDMEGNPLRYGKVELLNPHFIVMGHRGSA